MGAPVRRRLARGGPGVGAWEYAARAGTTTAFFFGDTITYEDANYWMGEQTRPVGSYPGNGFGIYDMHGNVWEWTQDCWHDSYDGAPDDGSAWESGDCREGVLRSGACFNAAGATRSAWRFYEDADRRGSGAAIGFRVARELDS